MSKKTEILISLCKQIVNSQKTPSKSIFLTNVINRGGVNTLIPLSNHSHCYRKGIRRSGSNKGRRKPLYNELAFAGFFPRASPIMVIMPSPNMRTHRSASGAFFGAFLFGRRGRERKGGGKGSAMRCKAGTPFGACSDTNIPKADFTILILERSTTKGRGINEKD